MYRPSWTAEALRSDTLASTADRGARATVRPRHGARLVAVGAVHWSRFRLVVRYPGRHPARMGEHEMTHAQTFADERATAYLRKGVVDMYQSITPGDHVREDHDRELAEARMRATAATLGDVWCHHCDQPAVAEIALTLGETRAYCARCIARITIQPGGARVCQPRPTEVEPDPNRGAKLRAYIEDREDDPAIAMVSPTSDEVDR